MAKKSNVQNNNPSFFQRAKVFLHNPNMLFLLGLLFGALAIFLCSSFLSFFSSGGADQSLIDATAVADSAEAAVENTSGKGGAVVADYLVKTRYRKSWTNMINCLMMLNGI